MLKIYNSLTKKIEEFVPINPPTVGMYTCGPTVYHYATIGNFRTYLTSDLLLRVLKYNGYNVDFIMNLTDVGHLTGDNEGDADTGEDRLEKAARKEGKNAWDIAKFYTQAFLKDFEALNLTKPAKFTKATDYIEEQIDLAKKLESNGFAYKINDGLYFDTVAFEAITGKKYGELSTLDVIKEGARIEPNPDKKNPRDFALWKFSEKPGERHMEWPSPWGIGWPGWHLECSAMSIKHLGETFDVHIGGEDLRSTHHPNEIAQSEGATGKKFVNYWVHGAFIKVDGKRMGKSLGNAYTVADILNKGFDPLALRYLYLTGHYRDVMNFTWKSLESAQNALNNLREQVIALRKQDDSRTMLSNEKSQKTQEYQNEFNQNVNNDLSMPMALATVWSMLKSNIPSEDKYDLLMNFDEVLGLNLASVLEVKQATPQSVLDLAKRREQLRLEGQFEESDKVRQEIENMGYTVKDTQQGFVVTAQNVKTQS
ncbi:MAG: cysteine--tRNA ligase [Patescibacteria group bacterium]